MVTLERIPKALHQCRENHKTCGFESSSILLLRCHYFAKFGEEEIFCPTLVLVWIDLDEIYIIMYKCDVVAPPAKAFNRPFNHQKSILWDRLQRALNRGVVLTLSAQTP